MFIQQVQNTVAELKIAIRHNLGTRKPLLRKVDELIVIGFSATHNVPTSATCA